MMCKEMMVGTKEEGEWFLPYLIWSDLMAEPLRANVAYLIKRLESSSSIMALIATS